MDNIYSIVRTTVRGLLILARVNVEGPEQFVKELLTKSIIQTNTGQSPDVGLYENSYRIIPAGSEKGYDDVELFDGGVVIDGWHL